MHLQSLYSSSLALLTDFYQLTMAQGYWKQKLEHHHAVFQLFFRKKPFHGGYAIAAGLESIIDFLQTFRFDSSDIDYLSTLKNPDGTPLFDPAFLKYLETLSFTGHLDAVPEGTPIFPFEPILRVEGPLIECQLLESALLNLFNFASLIATKAARICFAAQGDSVIEFGLRRAQGIDGALTASRSAYIGGCDSTSHVLAGKLFGIPVKGTHSHSWVMVFEDERTSFQKYAEALPDNCVFLVDTYDSIQGVENAIQVGKWLKKNGKELQGIRLDSGDLAYLSQKARIMLDEAGFPDAKIVASNELDESIIHDLKRQGAKIVVWGVGTNLVTGKDQPALDGVYKLSAIRAPGEEWQYKLKLSEQMAKISNPGILQICRYQENGEFIADIIYDREYGIASPSILIDPFDATRWKKIPAKMEGKDLLEPIFREGQCVYKKPSLKDIQKNTKENLSRFHPGIKRFLYPHQYIVGMEKTLYEKKIALIQEIRQNLQKP